MPNKRTTRSPSVATMTRRILRAWDTATPEQRHQGLHWYDTARDFAAELAAEFDTTLAVAACVIAAHSQNQKWNENRRRAHAQLAGHPVGLTAAIRTARNAMAHPRDPFAHIVDKFGEPLPKLQPFARCVAGDLTAVATDRWAQRVAYGIKGPFTRGHIAEIDKICGRLIDRVGARADMIAAYCKAAAEAGVEPAVMQATVWIVIRGSGE